MEAKGSNRIQSREQIPTNQRKETANAKWTGLPDHILQGISNIEKTLF
jgi:hypothetical protein